MYVERLNIETAFIFIVHRRYERYLNNLCVSARKKKAKGVHE